MRDRLVDILDRVEATLAEANELVPGPALDPLAFAARRIRNRLDYPVDLAIVALAGGTGSGKSSLFNAILGTERAEVGGLRPTTSRPLASVPAGRRHEVAGYLSGFGDLEVSTHEGHPSLILVDLPDTDSVEVDHRLRVDELLPMVDAVVWVVDVEKYRDHALHQQYLRRLVDNQRQFLFVVNQIDRIPAEERPLLMDDFRSALVDDGYDAPTSIGTAANPPLTGPFGVDELTGALGSLADGLAIERQLTDLEIAVRRLLTLIGDSSLGFETRWESTLDDALGHIDGGDLVAGSRVLSTFFLSVADELSGPAQEEALSLAAHAAETVDQATRDSEMEVPAVIARVSRWVIGSRAGTDLAVEERRVWLRRRVDELTANRVRPFLRAMAVARANLTGLAIEVAELRQP